MSRAPALRPAESAGGAAGTAVGALLAGARAAVSGTAFAGVALLAAIGGLNVATLPFAPGFALRATVGCSDAAASTAAVACSAI